MQGPARSSVAKKGEGKKKQAKVQSAASNQPATEETEDEYYSRSNGLKLRYLDTSAKSELCYFDTSSTFAKATQVRY